jgi:hypothetical protein
MNEHVMSTGRISVDHHFYWRRCQELKAQLAAAQAEIARLRELLTELDIKSAGRRKEMNLRDIEIARLRGLLLKLHAHLLGVASLEKGDFITLAELTAALAPEASHE